MARPLRVLIFSPDPSFGGGVAAFDAILKRRLGDGFVADPFIIGRRPGFWGKGLRSLMPLYDALRLAGRLLVSRHDVYHLNPSLDSRAVLRDGLFLLLLRLFRRKDVLVFVRGWDPGCFRRIAGSRLRRRLFLSTYGHAARVLVLGSTFAAQLDDLGFDRDKVHTATTMFDGALLREARRRRDDASVQVLFLARFVRAKGMYELLEAFRRVRRERPQLRLVMAGNGPEQRAARAWCEERGLSDCVEFPGHVEDARKAQLLVDSDIFALPSYHGEGCPNALLEAMGAGLPVITTLVGGIPDIVESEVNALIVAPRAPSDIAAALERLAGDPSLRERMGQRNRDLAWRRFEAAPVTAQIENHYRQVARAGEAVVV